MRILVSLAKLLRIHRIPIPVLLAGLFLATGFMGVAMGSWRNLCSDCPSIAQISTWEPEQTSKLLTYDGQLITEIGLERRTPVSLQALPSYIPQSFVAIEDKRFYDHHGFDARGIARAALRAILSQSFSGGGGSTITQQLARNMFVQRIGFEKRILRKLKELQVALDLESTYEKDQILEAYINQINFDRGWYGIQTASRNYFGKNATELNPAEAAMLAAIPKLPGYYNPLRHPDNALRRRNLVLSLMAEQGFLSQAEAEEWKRWPIPTERAVPGEGPAPYFEEWVRQMLDDRFGPDLYTGGFKVYTTLDIRMQRAARSAMDRGWERIEARAGFEHPKYEEYRDQTEAMESGESPYLQGLFVALDPITGDVRAMVGGRDFRQSKFNRATQSLRQAGSAFKPFVYASAIASGIPPSHILVDAPVVMPQVSGEEWKPQNFSDQFQGPITIREGLRRSINMIAIKLGMEVGLETVAQTASRMGIRTPIERFPSTTIGAAEVVPIQMAEAYSAFATLGTKVRAHPVLRVENADGEVVWEPQPERTQVLDSLVTRVVVSMLQDVVDAGTGYNGVRAFAGLPYEVPAAGKTGTTNDGTDVWFIGFTPNLLAAVWFGMDMPQEIRPGATGGGDAAPVWGEFMRAVYYGEQAVEVEGDAEVSDSLAAEGDAAQVDSSSVEAGPILEIPQPWPLLPGLITREVDNRTGLLASEWCPLEQRYLELFIPGTEPTEPCDLSGRIIFRRPGLPPRR